MQVMQFLIPAVYISIVCSGSDTLVALEGSIAMAAAPSTTTLTTRNASWLIDPQTEYDSVTNITITVKRLDFLKMAMC
jgi:hypothetical protein